MSDKFWMQKAYDEAMKAYEQDEVPVGAVLVGPNNECLASSHNWVQHSHDPCDHAEVRVIRQASLALNNHRLLDTTLYVTLEPCAMCAGLMVHARIKRLVFAARDFKTGAAGSVMNLLHGYPLNHKVQVDEGIMVSECSELLTKFFRDKDR